MERENNFKSNMIWNIVGTGFNAFNSLLFLVATTRINGITDSGIFSIAFSTACILYVVGIYAGRVYQVTESNKDINDKEYIINRILSCILMIILTIGFVFIKGYDWYKATIFILLSAYKCLEAFSDVLYGIMQKNDILHKVGKSYFIKGITSVIGFVLVDLITHNLIFASLTIIFVWTIVILFYDFNIIRKIVDFKQEFSKSNVWKIFRNGFFIFAISFLGLYLLNAPKYAIDTFLAEDMQTIFGIIVMPATVIGLMGQFILHPYLNNILKLYEDGNLKALNKLILKIIIVIAGFGIVSSVAAYFLGIPILNLIYGIDLNAYKIQLVIIIIASTLYNMGVIYSSVLTTIRKTFIQFVAYLIISIIAALISNILTKQCRIEGAVIAYFAIMFIYFVSYIIMKKIIIKKLERRLKDVN